MNLKIKHLSALLILTFFLGVTSCKRVKQIDTNLLKRNDLSMIAHSVPSSALPTVQNGILKFASATAYNNYVSLLDSLCIQIDSTDTVTVDAKYFEIESMLSYTSLRSVKVTAAEVASEVGWDNITDVPQGDYIIDKSTLSTLNKYGEVIIGSDYYCQSNSFDYVKIANYTSTLIANYQSVKEDPNIECLLTDQNYQFFHKGGVDDVIIAAQPSQYKTTADTLWKIEGDLGRHIYGSATSCTNALNNYYLVKLNLKTAEGYNIMPPPNSTCDMYVDWGDGTTSTYTINPSQQKHNTDYPAATLINNPKHNYTTNGNATTVTVTVKAKMHYHTGYVVEKKITMYIPPYDCRWANKCSPWIWTYSNDQKASMRGRIQAERQWLLGDSKYHAYTETYKWIAGKWRQRRMDGVYAKAYFDLLDLPNGCTVSWAEIKEAVAFNDNNAHARKTIYSNNTPNNAYSIIYSKHKFLYDGSWYVLNLQMKACD